MLLLRGNHESRNMTENFTFREEVISRYDNDTYNLFMELFDNMPISAIVDGKYFAMHGGISPDLVKIDQVEKINRVFIIIVTNTNILYSSRRFLLRASFVTYSGRTQ